MARFARQGPRRGAVAARLAVVAALLSAGAGTIHAVAAGPHLEEYAPFGIAFAVTAVLQIAWAVGVLVVPSRRLLGAGAVANAGVIVAWALSRTAGLPLGPDAWTPEPVTLLDAAATAFELGIVAASALLLLWRASSFAPLGVRRFAAAAAVAVAALTAIPIAVGSGGHSHDHGRDEAGAHAAHNHAHAAVPPATVARSKRSSIRTPRRAAAPPAHDHTAHDHVRP